MEQGASNATSGTLWRRCLNHRHRVGGVFFALAMGAVLWAPPTGDKTALVHRAAQVASTHANQAYLALGILGLLFLALRGASFAQAVRVIRVMLGETILVHVLKTASQPWLPRPDGGHGGFPSGHSAAAFALAFLLTERIPRLSWVWYAIAAGIAWSRVEVGAHYPYQVVGGMALGLIVAWLLYDPKVRWRRVAGWRPRTAKPAAATMPPPPL